MPAAVPALTVIVPAFNEADRIAAPLREIGAYLAAQDYGAEIVVVDDGSDDGTVEVVCDAAAGFAPAVRVLRCEVNRGKGHALKVGFAAARGEQILFTDADLSTPIEGAGRMLTALNEGADIAIGSRKAPGAEIAKHQPWYREQMGRIFTLIVRGLIADVSDATCGFKAFRAEVGRDLFSRVRVFDWSFDAEVLWITRQRGYRLAEVPVHWEDRAGTKVSLLTDTLRSLRGLARIRINAARGRYAAPQPAERAREVWSGGGTPLVPGAARTATPADGSG
jgi:glycosyltransferase involved in cell wall biosynthesis